MQTDQALPFYFCHFFPFQRCVWPLIVLLLFKFRFSVLLELRKCNGEQEYYTDQLIVSFEIKTNIFYMVFTKLAPVNYPSTRSHTKNYKGNLYKTHCSKIKKGSETLSRFRISLLPTSQWIKFSIYSLGAHASGVCVLHWSSWSSTTKVNQDKKISVLVNSWHTWGWW